MILGYQILSSTSIKQNSSILNCTVIKILLALKMPFSSIKLQVMYWYISKYLVNYPKWMKYWGSFKDKNISIIFTFSPLETAIREYLLAPTNTTQSLNMCGSKPSPPFPFNSQTLTSNRGFVKLTWLSLEPKEMPPLLPSAFWGTCRSSCRGFMHCKSGLHTSIAIFAINLLEARQLVPIMFRYSGTCF